MPRIPWSARLGNLFWYRARVTLRTSSTSTFISLAMHSREERVAELRHRPLARPRGPAPPVARVPEYLLGELAGLGAEVEGRYGRESLVTQEGRIPIYNFLSDEERRLFTTKPEGSHRLKIRNHIRSSPGLHQGTIRMASVPQSAIFSVSGARTPRWLPVHEHLQIPPLENCDQGQSHS